MRHSFLLAAVHLIHALLLVSHTVGSQPVPFESSQDYPQRVYITTTRATASIYSSQWDIQHKGSQRVQHKGTDTSNKELVKLEVILHHETELVLLEELQSSRAISYYIDDTQPIPSYSHRHLLDGIPELNCYRTLEEIYDNVHELAKKYPLLVSTDTIGESWKKQQQDDDGGHDIKVMVLSAPSHATKKSDLMILAGHHARELPPPEAVMQWAEHLLENYGKDADITWILERTNIHIVPIANPDGREIVQEHLHWEWRKNAHPIGCDNTKKDGVDLNRNYPFQWGLHTGSSSDPCSNRYHGSHALSEPESNAIYHYANQLFPDRMKKGTLEEATDKMEEACPEDSSGIFLDLHSRGDYVYFPWGYEDRLTPNHHSLLTMSAKLAHPGNYTLWGPGQDGFLYFVSGDVGDTSYGLDCIAFFGFEIGSEWYAPCKELKSSIVPIMKESLLYAAKATSAPYRIPLGPDILSICVDNTDPTRTTMMVKASDEALIVPWAVFEEEKSQSITEIRVFLNDHPYDGTSEGLLMKPSDGAFDSVDESAAYEMDTSKCEKCILYFVAKDAQGYQGPISAVYVGHQHPNKCAAEEKDRQM